MKKIRNSIIAILVGLLAISPTILLFGQKDFSGEIVYNITYPGANLDAQTLAMVPKTAVLKIKGDKSRMEMSMGMGGSTINIFDGEKKEGVTLMDFMGQKFAIQVTEESVTKEMEDLPDLEVEVTGETKEIAGYLCKKAVIKSKDQDEKMSHVVYFTDAIGSNTLNFNNPIFKDINGVMLEYSFDSQGMKMVLSAISVEKKKVSDREFEMPEGYKIMTPEELRNMFGGY